MPTDDHEIDSDGPAGEDSVDTVMPPETAGWPGIERGGNDRYVAGVAAGLARRFGVEVGLVRGGIAGIALALSGEAPALVPIIYLVCWLVLPEPGQPRLITRLFTTDGFQEIAAAVLVTTVTIVLLLGGNVWVIGLLVVGGLLLADVWSPRRQPGSQRQALSTNPPPPPPGIVDEAEVAGRWGRSFRFGRGEHPVPDEPILSGLAILLDRHPTADGAHPPMPLRQPVLSPLTLGLLTIWFIATISIDRLVNPGLPPGVIVNGAILIVGAVIALSAYRGRPGLLTWLALAPLAVAWVALSIDNIPRYERDGAQHHTVTEAQPGDTLSYTGGYGDITIDLTGLDLPLESEITVEVAQTGGRIQVDYPAAMALNSRTEINLGSINGPRVWGDGINSVYRSHTPGGVNCLYESGWFAVDEALSPEDCDPEAPTINLEIDAGISEVRFFRQP